MDFTFSTEQLEFRDTISSLLQTEVSSARALGERVGERRSWSRSCWRWGCIACYFQNLSGLGMNTIDAVLLAEACGKAACPEPLAETMIVASPLLVDVLDRVWVMARSSRSSIRYGRANSGGGRASHQPVFEFSASVDWVLPLPETRCISCRAMRPVRARVDPSRGWRRSSLSTLSTGSLRVKWATLLRATLNRVVDACGAASG